MKIGIIGQGVMGQNLKKVIEEAGHTGFFTEGDLLEASIISFPENPEVIIDFSHPNNLEKIIAYEKKQPTPLVMATTGFSEAQEKQLQALSQDISLLKSANFSLGVMVMKKVVQEMTALLKDSFDIEITEAHHHFKEDAPSGTALLLAHAIKEEKGPETTFIYGRSGKAPRKKEEVGIHALRGGTLFGKHEVLFAGVDETLSLTHEAYSKTIFAKGALLAATYLKNQPVGFYTMEDCLFGGKK